tara:strand:+ start:75 stop:308 length:234 start_codon:yes stop_codon:yes gene_type:complete
MVAWEYVVVGTRAESNAPVRMTLNGKLYTGSDLKKSVSNLSYLLNQFGQDGWELIHLDIHPKFATTRTLIFKRPSSE